jgi:hypothetical protein
MDNKVGIWNDAPEGTEFIVVGWENNLSYYKIYNEALILFTNQYGWV